LDSLRSSPFRESRRFIHAVTVGDGGERLIEEVELRGLHRGFKSRYDSHVHTTASDGSLTPQELASEVCLGGKTVVVTDHYSVGGVDAALAALEGLDRVGDFNGPGIVAGVEFSARVDDPWLRPLRKLHVLGVGVDHRSHRLNSWLADYRRLRGADVEYALMVKGDLEGRGFRFLRGVGDRLSARRNVYKVLVESMFSCPENRRLIERHFDLRIHHIASRHKRRIKNAQMRKRMVARLREDYGDFKAVKPSLGEVVDLVRRANGFSVVAHPVVSVPQMPHFSRGKMTDVLFGLADAGVDGVEAYTPTHRLEMADGIAAAALDAGLMVFGGSDTHRSGQSIGRFTDLPVPAGGYC
jgi:3',5'-nucleoside bisphosphate phosphatase